MHDRERARIQLYIHFRNTIYWNWSRSRATVYKLPTVCVIDFTKFVPFCDNTLCTKLFQQTDCSYIRCQCRQQNKTVHHIYTVKLIYLYTHFKRFKYRFFWLTINTDLIALQIVFFFYFFSTFHATRLGNYHSIDL